MSLVPQLPMRTSPTTTAATLPSLWNRTLPLQLERGDYLYLPGDPARSVFLVRSGVLRMARLLDAGGELTLDVAGPGELVGESALAERQRTTLAQAVTPARVAPLPVSALRVAMAQKPSLGLELSEEVVRRTNRLAARATLDALGECRQRVAGLLLELLDRYPEPEAGGTAIGVRLTHEEIARFVGAARETVTPLLVELRRERVIDYDRRRMLIRNPEALRRIESAPRSRASRSAAAKKPLSASARGTRRRAPRGTGTVFPLR